MSTNENPITYKGLREESNVLIIPTAPKRTFIENFTMEFEAKDYKHENFFTRQAEFDATILDKFFTDKNSDKKTIVIKDDPKTGLISFGIHQYKTSAKTGEYKWWSSRAGVVSLIPGYECVRILIDNCVYHMHLNKALEYVPEGYSLVQVHDVYDDGIEVVYHIVKTEDADKYPEYLVKVKPSETGAEIKGWLG